MSLFPKRPDGEIDWEYLKDSHYVAYLVKRPAYTFVLAMPRTLPPTLDATLPSFRIRSTDTRQTGDIALGMSELADLFEDLHQLMEYMRQERENRCGQL
jgi:hypothetical protein